MPRNFLRDLGQGVNVGQNMTAPIVQGLYRGQDVDYRMQRFEEEKRQDAIRNALAEKLRQLQQNQFDRQLYQDKISNAAAGVQPLSSFGQNVTVNGQPRPFLNPGTVDLGNGMGFNQKSVFDTKLNQNNDALRSRLQLEQDLQQQAQQPQIDEQNRIAGLALQDAPLNQIQQSAPNGLAPSASDIFQALEKRKSLFPQTGLLPHPISKPYRGTDGNLYQSVQDPTTGQFTTQKVQGAVEPAPTGTNQKATDSQQLFGIFGSRAAQSNKVLDHIESRVNTPTSKLDYLAGPFGPQLLGPYNPTNTFQLPFAVEGLKSQDRKMYEQAKRDFVNALLRKESGAAISSGEFDNADKQYFAQPGDGPQVVAQKQALRKLVVDLFSKAAKGERTAMQQLESAGGTPSQPTVNNTIVMPDGAQFQYEPAN